MRRQAALLFVLLASASAQAKRTKPVPKPAKLATSTDAASQLGRAYQAYRDGDLTTAAKLGAAAASRVANRDYALYVTAQSLAFTGAAEKALPLFRTLAGMADSRFADIAAWRAADCLWDSGRTAEARAAYEKLVPPPAPPRPSTGDISDSPLDGDPAVGLERIARAYRSGARSIAAWRRLALEYPAHPLGSIAVTELERMGTPLGARDRVDRAERLTAERGWNRALAELALVGASEPEETLVLRDYWTATTLFKMRRDYARAGQLYLAVHEKMGTRAAESLFHAARSLSRADQDDEAIRVYGQVIRKYPSTSYAAEAQFLSGWLEFNRGRFRAALPALNATVARYGSSKFAAEAIWYLGLAHQLLGEPAAALPFFEKVGARGGRLEGGKGKYWRARALAALGRGPDATAAWRNLAEEAPFSWYGLLARAQLGELGVELGTMESRLGSGMPPSFGPIEPERAAEPLIVRTDELLAAGMAVEAGLELRRGENGFIKSYGSARALPILFDRYDRAGNANRPWELAEGYGNRALELPPKASGRVYWEHAFPLAYREFIEKYQGLGRNLPYYLYSIMRKESGYDPHVVSYADAIGLLQMIPPTTQRVVRELDMEYTDDLLYDAEQNIKVGSWYIGHLALKFKQQIPIAAGSFNCGPKPVMRWLEQNGQRPIDEFVELVAYSQTREYMKKVTEIYARYLYLYEGQEYRQPLVVDANYLQNDLVY